MFPQPEYQDLRDVELQRCARVVVETLLGLQPEETFLVVGDTHQSLRLELALMGAAHAVLAKPALVVYPAAGMLAEEPLAAIAAAMAAVDAAVVATTRSLTHTQALAQARRAGVRVLSAPALTEENFLRTTDIDYETLARLVHRLGEAFLHGKSFRLTSEAGTDLKGEFGYQVQVTDGYCRKPGEFDQLAAGVAGRAPIEESVQGMIVAEPGRAGLLGLITDQVTFEVEGGRIQKLIGGREAARLQAMLDRFEDPNMFNIAEIGTGANPKASFTGYPMDDRRVIGAIHVGLGDNQRFFGGKVRARSHFDMAVLDHTLAIDGEQLIVSGKLMVE